MFPDLQTDALFPAWATDMEMPSIQAQENMTRHDDVAGYLQNYPPVEILTADGKRIMVLGSMVGTAAPGRWDLISSGGQYQLSAPLLVRGYTALEEELEIVNQPISIAPDSWVVLRMADPLADKPKFILANETEYKPYEWDENDYLTKVSLPLWRIKSESSDGTLQLAPNLHGVKYVGSGILALATHRVVATHRAVALYVPRLVPL